jgi:hypothetical protein
MYTLNPKPQRASHRPVQPRFQNSRRDELSGIDGKVAKQPMVLERDLES